MAARLLEENVGHPARTVIPIATLTARPAAETQGAVHSTLTLNVYLYCGGNPVTGVDPLGLKGDAGSRVRAGARLTGIGFVVWLGYNWYMGKKEAVEDAAIRTGLKSVILQDIANRDIPVGKTVTLPKDLKPISGVTGVVYRRLPNDNRTTVSYSYNGISCQFYFQDR